MIHHSWAGKPNAPVIVLSHSLGANHNFWAPQVQALSKEYRILLYDHRGHGQSASPEGDWSIEDFGNDTLCLLDNLGVQQFHFCGLSLGGMVGMWLASQAGNRVEKLILANTASWISDTTLLYRRIEMISQKGLSTATDSILKGWFSSHFRGNHTEYEDHILSTSAIAYIKSAKAVCEMNLDNNLDRISSPTLVISGKYDQATPSEWGKKIAIKIPRAEWQELPAAHMSNIEAPDAFNLALLDWLKD